jgi:hypothetical protein
MICRLVSRLPDLPVVSDALRSGAISPGVAAEIAEHATPDNEAAMVETTTIATGAQLQTLLGDYRRARRHEAERAKVHPDDDPATAPSTFWAGWVTNGRYRLTGDFRPDEGAVFEAAYEDARNAGRLDETTIDGGSPAPVVEGELRQEEKRRAGPADALLDLARTYLATRADDRGDLPEQTQLHVVRHLDPTGQTGDTLLAGSGALDPRVADLLACSAAPSPPSNAAPYASGTGPVGSRAATAPATSTPTTPASSRPANRPPSAKAPCSAPITTGSSTS